MINADWYDPRFFLKLELESDPDGRDGRMKRPRFSEEQIIGILKKPDAGAALTGIQGKTPDSIPTPEHHANPCPVPSGSKSRQPNTGLSYTPSIPYPSPPNPEASHAPPRLTAHTRNPHTRQAEGHPSTHLSTTGNAPRA
jgi:hypothetical protein